MTPKQEILKRYPKATAYRWTNGRHYVIRSADSGIVVATGANRREAWRRAAEIERNQPRG